MKSFLSNVLARIKKNPSDFLAVLFLASWSLVYFWQAALRQAVFFFGDIFLFFYPTHLAYADALRAGRLPLWEPRMLAGFPLFAEGQIAALYPLHPLLYGLFPIDVATNYDILLHLSWVAIGTYLFLRALKLQPASACLGALAFGFGGFFVPRLQHMSVMATASWLPWVLWAWEKHEQTPDVQKRRRWFAILALFIAIQLLGGHPQFAFLTVLLLCLYALVNWQRGLDRSLRAMSAKQSPSRDLGIASHPSTSLRTLATLAPHTSAGVTRLGALFFDYFNPLRVILVIGAATLGALLASAQLLPTYELSTVSNRAAGLLPQFFHAFSLRAVHYLMLFNPFLLGDPYPRVSVEVIGYIGSLPVILAIAAPFVRRDRRVVFFGIIALAALFLGLGDINVFYRGLRYLPLFNYFRVPSRFFYWYTFAAAILAAITFDYLLERARATTRLTREQKVVIAVFVILIAVVIGLVPALPLDVWLSLWVWLPFGFALVVAWIILGARRGLFTCTTLIALVIGVTALDLALWAAVYSKTYDETTPVADFYRPPSTLPVLKNLSPQDGRILTSLWIYPWMVTMRESLYPNVSLIHGVPNATGYTPLLPQLTSEYLEGPSAPMLNLMNVRYYIKPQMLPTDAKTEGDDLFVEFAPKFFSSGTTFPATAATRIKIVSSLAQSVDWRDGQVVAEIRLVIQDGSAQTIPLRAGSDTAEWAYERSDVRKVIKHSLPPLATTFPARSAFPTESHAGHNFLAQFDLTREGKPLNIVSCAILPVIDPGLLHVERVSFVTPEGKEISLADLTGTSDFTLIYRTNEVAVFENLDVMPRAFLVHDARVADDQSALAEMSRNDFKPAQTVLLADGAPIHVGSAPRDDESVRIVSYQPERVVVSAHAGADAYLVLADVWFRDWIARLDGIEVPLDRADLIFRAIRVPPGDHQIEFEYRPVSLYVGAAISAMALVIIGAIFVWTR